MGIFLATESSGGQVLENVEERAEEALVGLEDDNAEEPPRAAAIVPSAPAAPDPDRPLIPASGADLSMLRTPPLASQLGAGLKFHSKGARSREAAPFLARALHEFKGLAVPVYRPSVLCAALMMVEILAACGSHRAPAGAEQVELPRECDAFVSAYERTLAAAAAADSPVARARAEQTREALKAELRSAGNAEALATKCSSNLATLMAPAERPQE